MSNISLLSQVKRGYVIFSNNASSLNSGNQPEAFVTPGIGAKSLYSKYTPSHITVNDNAAFIKEREAPILVANEGGEALAKPHLDSEPNEKPQIGHGVTSPSEDDYELEVVKLLENINHRSYNTIKVEPKKTVIVQKKKIEKSKDTPVPLKKIKVESKKKPKKVESESDEDMKDNFNFLA